MSPEEAQEIRDRIEKLEKFAEYLVFTDRYKFFRNVEFMDGRNIILSGVVGTKIGTTSTQKLGFFGKTPVTRRTAPAAPTGGTTIDGEARGVINDLRTVLSDLGLTG